MRKKLAPIVATLIAIALGATSAAAQIDVNLAFTPSTVSPGDAVTFFGSAANLGAEPVVADLDNDGKAEVIFTSWTQKGNNTCGKLHILNSQGMVLQEVILPINFGGDYNGALPAPTLGNVDADANLEIVINTVHSGVVVYDLPGITNARILWGTGRGSYLRDGAR